MICFEYVFVRFNGNLKCGGGGLDFYINFYEGDGNGIIVYGIW